MPPSPEPHIPQYRVIADQVAGKVQAGKYGDRLPTLLQLADDYGVGMVTMRRAIGLLQKEGIVTAAPRRGIVPTRLRRKRTNTLGVVIGSTDEPLGGRMFYGFEAVSQRRGQSVVFKTNSENVRDVRPHLRQLVEAQQVDGIMLWSANESLNLAVDYLRTVRVPFVLVPEPDLTLYSDCHTINNADSGAAAEVMAHLIGLGHRRIGFVSRSIDHDRTFPQHRRSRYERAMERAGLVPRPTIDPSLPLATVAAELRTCTAVFCLTDIDANLLLRCCLAYGIRVPQELAVAGYDNTPAAVDLGLTSVEQHFERIGAAAVELLLAELDGALDGPIHRSVDSELIIRRSTVGD